jgi:hypothetical protein
MPNVEQVIEGMLSDTVFNRMVLLGADYDQRERLRKFITLVGTHGFDARDVELPWNADPIETLAPSTYQIFTKIAGKKSPPETLYHDLITGKTRNSLFSLPEPKFVKFQELLLSFMDPCFQEAYSEGVESPLICAMPIDAYTVRAGSPVIMGVPQKSYGVLVCHSRGPIIPQGAVEYDA